MVRRNRQADGFETLDRIKRLAIVAIFSDDEFMDTFVLKGGNALDLIHGVAARSSVDLDFSMAGDFTGRDLNELRDRTARLLERAFTPQGYRVLDVRFEEVPAAISPNLQEFWGGYRIEFKIIPEDRARILTDLQSRRRQSTVVGPRQKRTFSIDISKHEYVEAKEEAELEGYTIYVYPPAVIAMEKLRAICQQSPEYIKGVKSRFTPRARDFFDICVILEHCRIELTSPPNIELLRQIFEAKRVPLDLLDKISPSRESHRADYPALQDSVYSNENLKPFDFYFDYVVSLGERLLHRLREI